MSKTISTKGMSEEAWLKQRRSSIGGSDAAALLGKSKYKVYGPDLPDIPNQIESSEDNRGI